MLILQSLIAVSSCSISVYEKQSLSRIEWLKALAHNGWRIFLREMQKYPLFILCVLYLLLTFLGKAGVWRMRR